MIRGRFYVVDPDGDLVFKGLLPWFLRADPAAACAMRSFFSGGVKTSGEANLLSGFRYLVSELWSGSSVLDGKAKIFIEQKRKNLQARKFLW